MILRTEQMFMSYLCSVHEEFGRANITIVINEKTADMWDTWYDAVTDNTDNGIYG